jgi:type IV secretory pathway protease TraF
MEFKLEVKNLESVERVHTEKVNFDSVSGFDSEKQVSKGDSNVSKIKRLRDYLGHMVFKYNLFGKEIVIRRYEVYVVVISFILYLYAKFIGYIGFTTSPSVPIHMFYVAKIYSGIDVGDYVELDFWGSQYYPEHEKMVKKVACKEGMYLKVVGRDYYCNGVYLGRAKERDRYGKYVENFKYDGVIPEGYYFLLGTHPDSYDSRYYGFAPRERVVGKVLFIFF